MSLDLAIQALMESSFFHINFSILIFFQKTCFPINSLSGAEVVKVIHYSNHIFCIFNVHDAEDMHTFAEDTIWTYFIE